MVSGISRVKSLSPFFKMTVLVMAAMMYLGSPKTEMGEYTLTKGPLVLGWTATTLMGAAAIMLLLL